MGFLSVLLIFIVLLQLIYSWYFYAHFTRYVLQNNSKPLVDLSCPPVTVIICFKNEAENLSSHLPLLFEQDYPNKKFLLVNDHSSDNSVAVVKALTQKFQEISVKLIHLEAYHGKKAAIKLGVQKANDKLILVTDADGQPQGKSWIKTMVACQQFENADVVLGYGPLISGPSFVSKLAKAETIMTAMNYFSFAYRNQPYMGIGRNMLFKKAVFMDTVNRIKGKHLVSGDDDLFINALTNNKISFCLNQDSFIWSSAKSTFKEFWKQKSRHISTSVYYQFSHQFLLLIYALPTITFWPLVFCNFLLEKNTALLLIIIIIKYSLQFKMMHKPLKLFSQNTFSIYYAFWEFILGIYYGVMGISMFARKNEW